MLKNYFKIALRNLRKYPGYSFINIFGLALGMGICILILLFIQYELSYDTYHEKSDRIVRVSRQWFNQDGESSLHLGHVAPPFAPLLEEDFDGIVQEAVRFFQISPLLTYQDESFVEQRFFFVDPDIFEVFSWEMLQGDPVTALTYPDGMVITQSAAKKYFGSEDPMGKNIEFQFEGNVFQFQVRGVLKDIPENSHFQFDFLASMEPVTQYYGGVEAMMQNYGSNNFATYLLLPEGYDHHQLQAQLPDFIDRHLSPGSQGITGSASKGTQLNLWPLTDIHLYSHLDSEIEANGHIEYIYIYTAIAFFILLIACINFMNLSTARSAKRAIEVGLRKAVGADRGALMRQFVGESILLALLSLVGAVILVELILPWFNNFVDKPLTLELTQNWSHLLGLLGIVLFVGMVAGSYPAFFLSAFQPATVLKGSFKAAGVHERFRSVLVVAQFTISIALIVCMIVVQNQLDFLRSKDLGFNQDDIVVLPSSPQIRSNYENIRRQMLEQPGIINVSLSSRVPSGRLLDSQGTTAEVNGELQQINTRIADIHVSHNFMDTYGIELVAGRDFNFELASDSAEAFILNESAVQAVGWSSSEEALDKQFQYGGRSGRIIGVVRDFNFESLHQSIAPIVFLIPQDRINNVSVKIKDGMRAETLAYLEEQWSYWRAGFPFSYFFVGDSFDEQYATEERLGEVFGYFSLLAIIIAALGLFGLASFTAQQRVKEIGIRKVLGASVGSIVLNLSKRFTMLVLLAFVIAIPIAYIAMQQWLRGFAYQMDISPTSFLLAGGGAIMVAWLTISYQSVKAAMTNPVNSLRSE
ncbi:ABC transporter permease [Aliifodinibius sp. S!AR15-10]|uniref:ABC transporter permease n=1 Tax=Aliifodinibius sp. S!AR15-10 TaxID=2950437 RepID=UPI00285F7D13|nr:ABC transporter permease [Aliifodinibius sp. S!AR15-10]MDR8393691.1 ABC transporter permease [Aliifodinibius sp. S!AR15-10]